MKMYGSNLKWRIAFREKGVHTKRIKQICSAAVSRGHARGKLKEQLERELEECNCTKNIERNRPS